MFVRSAPRVVALAAGLALLTGCAGTATAGPSAAPGPGLHGREPDVPVTRPSFTLSDDTGRPYDFAARTAGRPTLLFFGYTHCPDVCVTAMADITAALRLVPRELRESTEVVFVTTDPARDDGPTLRRWLDRYSPRHVGLTGTREQVDAAQRAAGVPLASREGALPTLPGRPDQHEHRPGTAPHTHDGPLGYGVGHSSLIYAYDVRDRLPVVYAEGTPPSDLAADLPFLAGEEPS